MVDRIYQRMKDYNTIKELAVDSPKIANLANEEVIYSFIELVYKFQGLDFLTKKLSKEENEIFKLNISSLLLPIDKSTSLTFLKELISSNKERVSESSKNIVAEKYSSIEELSEQYQNLIMKYAKRMKIEL